MIMIDQLNKMIHEKGYTQNEFAELLGSSRKALQKRIRRGKLGSEEMNLMIKILDIKNPAEIFFNN